MKLLLITFITVACALQYQFPEGFRWGTATASYQIEGANHEDGKGIWDVLCMDEYEQCKTNSSVAIDFYHRWRDDLESIASLGVKHFRFSIAWTRIFPRGDEDLPNPIGLQFYSDLVDALLSYGIQPVVTLYHWNLPVYLEMTRDGLLDEDFSNVFLKYAQTVFELFGDRVPYYITFNEPWCASMGYGDGYSAPLRTKNADTEIYIAAHNQLLAHAKAVEAFRATGYQGEIGITLNIDSFWPKDPKKQGDIDAANRAMEWFLGWFAHPIVYGDYPESMRETLKERLPHFSHDESTLIKGSFDIFYINHYSTHLVERGDVPGKGWNHDVGIVQSVDPSWNLTDMDWPIVPEGLKTVLLYIRDVYGSPEIMITENGMARHEPDAKIAEKDQERIDYLSSYLTKAWEAIDEGVNLIGYMCWSQFDNLEWRWGNEKRFGLIYVDPVTLERTIKHSMYWYSNVMHDNGF